MASSMPGFLVGYAYWPGSYGEIPSIEKETGTYKAYRLTTVCDGVCNLNEEKKNRLGAIPGLNLISGISRILKAFLTPDPQDDADYRYYYTPGNLLRYRVTQFTVGVLEITLVGGWIVHGVATAYFYATRDTTPYTGQRHVELV